MKLKFSIGDEVKFFKDPDSQAGKIVSFAFDPKTEQVRYTFEVPFYDLENNKMATGVRTCLEEELVKKGVKQVLDEVVESEEETENE